jgi:hypothetical protein
MAFGFELQTYNKNTTRIVQAVLLLLILVLSWRALLLETTQLQRHVSADKLY